MDTDHTLQQLADENQKLTAEVKRLTVENEMLKAEISTLRKL
jgi:hypothetical protein